MRGEMIERVARALAFRHYRRVVEPTGKAASDDRVWQEVAGDFQSSRGDCWRVLAVDAIEAMLEPSDTMVKAAGNTVEPVDQYDFSAMYRAAITAALEAE